MHGNITYINQDFINISGFSDEELIGAPQNIVRHPDMPVEAFVDFWRTIKSGKAWAGLVKNRCKNGDYYWVEVNAVPMLENGKIVGYTSIQAKPSREKVAAAERAYHEIKNGSKTLGIREDAAVTRSFLRRFDVLATLSIRAKITFSFGILALLFVANLFVTTSGNKQYGAWSTITSMLGIGAGLLFGYFLYRAA